MAASTRTPRPRTPDLPPRVTVRVRVDAADWAYLQDIAKRKGMAPETVADGLLALKIKETREINF